MKFRYYLLFLFVILTHIIKSQETTIIDDKFTNNSNQWPVTSKEDKGENINKIENGKYVLINNSSDKPAWTFISTSYNREKENFYVEAELNLIKGDDNFPYGILLGMFSDNSDYKLFYITNSGHFKISHFSAGKTKIIQDFKPSAFINKKGINTLAVKHEYNCTYFYINNKLVYTNCEMIYWGGRFGFYLSNGQTITVGHFLLKKTDKKIPLVNNAISGKVKEHLSNNVNTKYTELIPLISPDGKTLFFCRTGDPSNTGGASDYDIWYSTLDKNDMWIPAKNVGFPLNNTGANAVQSVSPDNNTLIVSNAYKADGSPEGNGLSYSEYQINGWEIPVKFNIKNFRNINPTVDFFLSSDNKILLIAMDNGKTLGQKDIFISFRNPDNTFTEPST
ncbi:MAG TPA: hypothetical protein VNX68_04930, partial [Nitrosopumilaceae archaeon]|nr:hypothetical protein [Nitrosopumilaceae archaeon]